MKHIVYAITLSGCISVNAITVSQKSALEQQFIGEYEELSDDLVTMASVRSAANGLGLNGDDPYARALQARRLQAFYKDDLDRLRQRGCVGEAADGRVKVLQCTAAGATPAVPSAEPKAERIASIENAAREALVDYALAKNAQLSDADLSALWQAYHRVVLSSLAPGSLVQNQAGQWVPHAR